MNAVRLQGLHRAPPLQLTMSVVKLEGGPAASGGHNDQSRQGHQCSKTTLTGESRFHISSPLGIEPGYLMMGSKGLTHWTSETVCECSEIAGSPQ